MNVLRTIFDQLRLTWRLLLDPRVPLLAKFIPFLAIAYVISPIDVIPDIVIGLGQLDDLGVIMLGLRMFEGAAPSYVVEEHRARIQAGHNNDEVIEADYTIKNKR